MRSTASGGRRLRPFKLVFVLGAFVAAGTVAVGVVSGADQPSISSDRSDYAPGDAVALSGAGWRAGEAVELLVDDEQDDPWSHAAEVDAGDDGTVSESFDLPETTGEFTVTATAPSGAASATFIVSAPEVPPPPPAAPVADPTLTSDQDTYTPGDTVTLSGSDWPAGDTVQIAVDDDAGDAWDHSADVTVDADGSFEQAFALPSGLAASFTATATDATGRSAGAEFSASFASATEPHLVRFASGTSAETQAQILAAAGAEDVSYIAPLRIHGVLLPGGAGLQVSLDRLRSDPSVTRVEPDRTREAGGTPSDASYGDQWSLPKIGWDNAFGELSPSGSARVAILDTGVDGSHTDLDGNLVPGTSILDGSNGLSDPNGHGTAMAGIVAAETNNGAGVAGVGYAGVQVMPVTVLGTDGTGQDSDIIEGVVYAAEHDADVILMAFSNPGYSEMLQAAIDYAWEEGAVLAAATGNDGSSSVTFPAGDRGVIGVSNTDENDALNGSSNHGQAVFLGAPGTGIATTSAGGGTTTISGTSAAAAHVAGAAALIKAASGASNGVIVSRLARTADPAGTRDQTGNGRLNLDRAIADTSTDSIQPAGADPLGGGGPMVGPYVAASPDIYVDVAPTQYAADAAAIARTFSVLVQSRNSASGDTVGCIRINFPSAYGTITLVPNGASVSTGAATWNAPVADSANDRISWTATTNGNRLAANGWARLTFTVVVPAGSGDDGWTIGARNSISTSGGSACATAGLDTSKTQGIRRGSVSSTYTTAFVGSSTVVTGVPTPVVLRVTKNTSGGLKIDSAVAAFPACFTLASAAVVPGTGNNRSAGWEASTRDGVLRLWRDAGLSLENANHFVEVTFTVTAPASCSTSTVLTSAFEGEARVGTAADKVHADADGVHPTITVGAANTAPTVAFNAPPTTANESETKTFNFTITDPDVGDTFTFAPGFPVCGTGGAPVGSPAINSVTKTGSFQCLFADGPATPIVQVRVRDAALAESNTASQTVTVANVVPSIAISGAATVNEGAVYTLTLGAVTDPGPDTITSYVVHWGDGTDNAYATAGSKTHTYADGPANRSITVDLVDEDGTHLNRANALSVQVDNVAPSIAISGDASVSEGSSYSLTLGAVTDPGTDSVTSYVVHWGDGSTDAYSSNGVKTHTYADGPATRSITVDLVDEDGTHLNRANALSVSVTNVAPSVTAPAGQTADEGTSTTFDLGSFTEPGDDDPWQVTVDWGDGSSDTVFSEASPGAITDQAHEYDDNGTFTVTVTVAEDSGVGASGSATLQVTVANVAPEVTAAADQTATEGTSTLFALGSFTDPGDDDPWEVTVDWGDGSADTAFVENAPGTIAGKSHMYVDDGTFTVTVTVAEESGAGASDNATFQVTVANVAPNVTAPADQTANEGSSTSFSLGSFTDPGDDDPWEVTVDWGDGSSDTTFDEAAAGAVAAQTHTYADNGAFTVTVSVREDDGTGATGSATFEVTVANVAPQVTAAADQTADEATSETFDLGSFTDPGDDDPWQVTVDWGDGSADTVFTEPSTGAITDTAHTYADNGVFTVTVTVKEDDGAGAAGSATFQVTVANLDPEITNVSADTPIDEGGSSTVTVTATDPAGANDPLSYEFDCNDDTTFEVGPQAGDSHACSFGDNGNFSVNVRVTDGDGGSDTASTTIVVQNVDPTITAVTADSPIDEGESSTVSVSATDPAGPNDPLSYEFDCDGNSVFEVGPQASSSHSCSFDDNGAFTVNVRVTDGDGGSATDSVSVQVDNVPPTIAMSGAADVNEGASYSLTLGAVTDPGNDTVQQWIVHWGDGETDTYTSGGVKTHTYDDGPNTHSVTVDLVDEDGTFVDRANAHSVDVDNVPPTIAISGAASVNEGSSYSLTLGAVTDPGDDTVTSWVVHWGDGSSTTYSSGGDVTHTYADGPDTYAITVDLVDEDGTYLDRANAHSVQVTNVPPTIAITGAASVNEGSPYSLTLGAVTDPGADTVTQYVVHWGDGSSDSYVTNGVKTHTYADGPGTHAITVDLTDEDGTFLDRANDLSVQVDNVAPAVTAPANQTASEGTAASFSLGSFTDPGDDDPWAVTVDWGDGSTDTSFNEAAPGPIAAASHTYADDGTFTVTVSVREDGGTGATGSATFQVTVANVAPDVTAPANQAATEGSSTSFSLGSFTDPGDDDPWQVTVQWGDGSPNTVFTEAAPGPIAAKPHTYADDGIFTVTVSVREDNGAGAAGSATFLATVANVAPEVTAPADQAAYEGTAKTFDLGSFTDPGADSPWRVTVDWGDASTDTVFTEAAPGAITDKPHTYADDGAFTVTITVDEESGTGPGTDSATFQVTVANVAPTVATPTFDPTLIGCQTATTLKNISFSDPGTIDRPWTVSIDWGDGSPDTTYPTNTQGAQPNQSHVYATAGTFTATVSVTDKDGDTGSNATTTGTTVFPYTVEFRPPVDGSTAASTIVNKMKNGRVVPVKVIIRDLCGAADVLDPSAQVTIKVTKSSGTSGPGDPVEEYADAGNSSGGTNLFRHGGDHWIYNLDSKALGLVINNRYRVDVYVNNVWATVTTWAILEPVK